MVIDRSKHNKYSVNLVYTPSSTALTEQQTALSESSLIIYVSGGSGLTEEQLKKLESIEEGALVNQNAFSTVLVSDGSITNEITAQNPSDTIKFTYVSPIKISLIDGNIQISYEDDDALWKLDEDGNLWTDRNVYSTKEISAYGFSEEGSPSGGANYLYELSDVDSATATSPIDDGILQYNAVKKKWVVTDGSGIKPDLNDYATKLYVTELINLLVGTAPDVLDTIYEIAEALNNDPDYVKDIANDLSNLTNKVVKLEDMFEWDNGKIKAKADLYGVGEISAYGYSSGSPSSGAQYLYQLLDVDLTNLADQCILQYNSITKKWEATDGSNIKPDLSAYATQMWVTLKIWSATESLRNEFNSEISEIENSIVTIKQDIVSINDALDLLNKMFEWDGDNIKAKANLYGVGEISAYGYQDGSASSEVQYLHLLLDVTLTELTSGLLLQWDGSKWVNINKDEVGLNESELLQYLTENNYAKKSDIPKTISWTNITNKPSWITNEKPTYSWTDITNKPTIFTTNIENISDLNSSWDSLLKNKPTAYITRWPSFSEVTNKPTTLSGYGITDGVNSITLTGSGNAVTSASINGHVITLTKGSTFSLSTHNHDSVYVNVTGDTMTGTLTLPTIVVNTRIQLGNAYIEYDSTNNAVVIKNKTTSEVINLYATGEVSAYGYSDETNPPRAMYLSELKDVKLTSIVENDMLVWNGSMWVNTPMADITPELNVDNITDLNASWRTLLKSAPSAYVTRWPTISEVTNKKSLIIKLNSGTTEGTNLFTYNVTTAKTVNITPSAIGAAAKSHNHSWSNITSGKPTTLAGYGITDGVNAVSVTGSGNAITAASVSGHTLTLTKGSTFLLSSAYTAADILAKLKTVDGSGSGLDADLLDGQHSTYYVINKASDNVDFNTLTRSGIYRLSYTTTEGSTNGPHSCSCGQMLVLHGGGDTISQIAFDYMNEYIQVRSGNPSDVGGPGSWKSWRYLAFKDDNVASATKLQTPRTLWGKYFDGTASVSGDMSSVGNISMSGNITGVNRITTSAGVAGRYAFITNGGEFNLVVATGGWASGLGYYQTDGSTIIGYSAGAYGVGNTLKYYYYGGSYSSPKMIILSSGNVGIGTTSPSYKLHVAGTMYATGATKLASTLSVTGLITATAGLTTPQYIQIGSGRIYWDSTNKALYVKSSDGSSAVNFYATGEVSAYGAGSGGGEDVGNIFGIKVNGQTYKPVEGYITIPDYPTSLTWANITGKPSWIGGTKPTYTFSEITSKPTTVKGYGITDAVNIVSTSGSGNVVTSVSKSGTSLTVTKGITAALSTGTNASGTWPISISGRSMTLGANPTGLSNATYGDYGGFLQGSRIGPTSGAWYNIIKILHSNTEGYYTELAQSFTGTEGLWHRRMSGGSVSDWKTILDSSNYAATLDTRYIKKSGDTMTGNLTISSSNPRVILNYTSNIGTSFFIQQNGTTKAAFGYNTNGPFMQDSSSTNYITINSNSLLWNNTSKFWHEGNDGSGSGLDADLLDGYHIKNIQTGGWISLTPYVYDSTNGMRWYWYKIATISDSSPTFHKIEIDAKGDADYPYAARCTLYLSNFNNGTTKSVTISEAESIDNYGRIEVCMDTSGNVYIRAVNISWSSYLRYRILYGSYGTVYESPTKTEAKPANTSTAITHGGIKLNIDNTFVYSSNYLQGISLKAIQLNSVITIWGQSFDGTGNVSGDLSNVGRIKFTDTDSSINPTSECIIFTTLSGAAKGIKVRSLLVSTSYSSDVNDGCITASGVIHGSSIYADTGYFYTQTGWFQNNKAGTGLYNSAEDARWYANSYGWNTDKTIIPTRTNAFSLGISSVRWSNVYSVLGNFSGAVTMSNTVAVSGAATLSSTLNIAGTLTASNGIVTDYDSGTWLSMATRSNLIRSTTNNSASGAHALFRVKNSGGDAIVFGGLGTDCGFYGFTAETISAGTNSYNWTTYWNVATGKLTHNNAMAVSGAVTLSSTLSVASASTFTGRTTHNGGITAGYSNTSYKISTASFICQSWIRTTGDNGWYSETHGGGIYMTDSTYVRIYNSKQLYVNNNIIAKGEVTAYSSSDIRLKKNLKELKAINTLRKINTFEYDWTEEALLLKANKNVHDYGIIAQELELIIPEAVTHDMYGKGYLGIDYTKLIPFAISAIKEVDDEVTTLKKRVKELEDRLSKYESSVK